MRNRQQPIPLWYRLFFICIEKYAKSLSNVGRMDATESVNTTECVSTTESINTTEHVNNTEDANNTERISNTDRRNWYGA